MPPGDCLGALEMLESRNLQFPHRVPFSQRENALVPLPFKQNDTGLHGSPEKAHGMLHLFRAFM